MEFSTDLFILQEGMGLGINYVLKFLDVSLKTLPFTQWRTLVFYFQVIPDILL